MDLDPTLRRMFAAANARDWATYAVLLHPAVVWTRVDDDGEQVVTGREAHLAGVTASHAGSERRVECLEATASHDGCRVVTRLVDTDGQRCAAVYEIADGLVTRGWEFRLGRDRTPPRPPLLEVTDPVLGVDGCRAGWVGALLVPGAPRPRVVLAPTIVALVEAVRADVDLRLVGIDIPIGLPDASTRRADVLARRALPGRASSVFTTLTRAAYLAATREEADTVNRGLSGQGVGAQAFALRAKILEVDAWVRSRPSVAVLEVHPELSFATMAGSPMTHPKKSREGVAQRLEALAAAGVGRPSVLSGSGYAVDDVLDACAVMWTVARRAAGTSRSYPDPPEVFGDGIPAAIHA